ncbi:MAG: hypothetical protein NW224_17395 [Leptolyngbyaceae cyanobacterium bins.302]|nr:hypothetical protein [Leptolyngbyaceae cyanobacterium bins.302]
MSRQEKRGRTAWWLPVAIGIILLAAGVRYLSSTEWWANQFNRDRQTLRTINTGASVQISASTNDAGVRSDESSPRPVDRDREPMSPPANQGRRLW